MQQQLQSQEQHQPFDSNLLEDPSPFSAPQLTAAWKKGYPAQPVRKTISVDLTGSSIQRHINKHSILKRFRTKILNDTQENAKMFVKSVIIIS